MKIHGEQQSRAYLLFIVLLGLVLRVYHLGFFPLWDDEAFTRFYSENSLAYLWTTGFRLETNPPLYYSIIHFWMALFGFSEIALRSFSVIASLVCIVLVYVLGKELENRSVGLIAAFLMAVLPTEIWYAQETRSYVLLQLAIGVTMLGLARYLSRSQPWDGLLIYAVGATFAAYFHSTALFFVVACNLAVFGMAVSNRSSFHWREMVPWLVANLAVAVALFPLFIVMLQQRKSPNIMWIPPLSVDRILFVIRDTVGGPAANRVFLHGHSFSYLLLLAIAIFLYQARKLNGRSMAVVVCIPLLFIALIGALSLHKSIFLPRVFSWMCLPLSLVWAHVLFHSVKTRIPLLVLTALLLWVGLDAQLLPPFSPKENWREVVQANQEELSKADLIVVASSMSIGSLAYYSPSDVPRIAYWRQKSDSNAGSISETLYCEKFKILKIDLNDVQNAIQSGKCICLVAVTRDSASLSSRLATLRPPDHRFDEVHSGAYEFHFLTWGGGFISKQSK